MNYKWKLYRDGELHCEGTCDVVYIGDKKGVTLEGLPDDYDPDTDYIEVEEC